MTAPTLSFFGQDPHTPKSRIVSRTGKQQTFTSHLRSVPLQLGKDQTQSQKPFGRSLCRSGPDVDESVSWLPVDYAAKAIIDLVKIPSQRLPLAYAVDVRPLVSRTRRPEISSPPEVQVRASLIDEVNNPSRKLLTFFENKYGQEELATRYPLLTVQTEKASKSLRSAHIADDGLVGKWVAAWRETSLLA
ncbi:uncharacterized protein F5891DRAFT_1246156 [Suillus fuscotomentosus]|uniref:Uncharacterized protein n=1 Tax=Suillus fuscotomentosus TaxID=1912939 RepID=A0AAD4HHF5_9AGAM|nr:uncharacterized protein F5891DRAFT_1246156 [Suillus fuscotomentosus]KAG1896622.1 hypothetical protein F5891DRAFT_1246156 [Suillus fuscotomentosus]